MLKLRRDGTIHRAQGPAILSLDDAANTGRKERLDGQDQPFGKDTAIAWIIKVQDFLWILMQMASNAMTGQIVDDVIAALARFGLDRSPDPV
jgi:hypothetical protein